MYYLTIDEKRQIEGLPPSPKHNKIEKIYGERIFKMLIKEEEPDWDFFEYVNKNYRNVFIEALRKWDERAKSLGY